MTTSAKFFLTLFSASLLLTACQSKPEQVAKPASSSQPSSSAIVKKQPTTSSSVAASQEESTDNSETSDTSTEEQVAETTESPAETSTIPEQLVGTWEVNQDGWVTRLTYAADGSVTKEVLNLDGETTSSWQSSVGHFHDLGNGAVRFDELGGDWATVAQTGLGGGFPIHTGVVFHEDGSISTKVWQFDNEQDPATYEYPTDGGVLMTRVD